MSESTQNTSGAWVIDPAGSSATFTNKAFWGLATVRGTFGGVTGNGTVAEDGTISGQLAIDTAKLDTKNKRRDDHLRSADFFDTAEHPSVIVTISAATRSGDTIEGTGTIEAAGKTEPVTITAHVDAATPESVTLTGELAIDRHRFGMTWNQMGSLVGLSKGSVTARFIRP